MSEPFSPIFSENWPTGVSIQPKGQERPFIQTETFIFSPDYMDVGLLAEPLELVVIICLFI